MRQEPGPGGSQERVDKPVAVRFVVLLGLVSMFADATYESSRSINGPYLATLGAGAAVVGVVAGLSELADYGLRFVSGYLADRTGKYWPIAFLGFGLNMAAVPLLALVPGWEMAAALILAERTGKASRNPARDAMLSHATRAVGHGRGFGLQEALGQVGAVAGPLAIAALLHFQYSYRFCLAVLVVPAVATLGVLEFARRSYPHPRRLEAKPLALPGLSRFRPEFWLALAAAALMAAGYVDYPLVAYHFRKSGVVSGSWIPSFYAVAMGMDAVAALVFGHLFDRHGISVLVVACLLSSLAAPLSLWGGFTLAMLGMAAWGVGLGAQKAILKAGIVGMVAPERRGTAYGFYNAAYGVFWFLGSSLMGSLYERSHATLAGVSVAAELAAVPLILLIVSKQREADRPHWSAPPLRGPGPYD